MKCYAGASAAAAAAACICNMGLYNNPARRIYGRSKHNVGDSTFGL